MRVKLVAFFVCLLLQVSMVSCSLGHNKQTYLAPVILKGERYYGDVTHEYDENYILIVDDLSGRSNSLKKSDFSVKKISYHSFKEVNSGKNSNSNNLKHAVAKNDENLRKILSSFIFPLNGAKLSKFSDRTDEACIDGIDIEGAYGEKVKAASDGRVIYIGQGLRWYGKLVIIEHHGGVVTLYSYLSAISVKNLQYIKKGQIIGTVGKVSAVKSDINDDRSYICFIVRINGIPVDPINKISVKK